MEYKIRTLEEQLKDEANLRRLAVVVRDSNDAVTVQDFSGHILAWNLGAVRLYGYSEEKALGMNALNLVPEERQEENRRMLANLAQGAGITSFETQRMTKDGRVLDVWLVVSPLSDAEGLTKTFSTSERDITERKRMEQELIIANKALAFQNREKEKRAAELKRSNEDLAAICEAQRVSEEALVSQLEELQQSREALAATKQLYQELFENVNVGILRSTPGPEGTFIDMNPAMVKLFEADSREQLLALHPSAIYWDASQRKVVNDAIVAKGFAKEEIRFKTLKGKPLWCHINSIKNTDASGKVYFDSTIEDITERKRVEEALKESEERLRFALDEIETGAWDLDLVDHSAYRSLKHDQIFGYETLLPQWTYEMFLEHVMPEDRAVVDQKFRQAMESKGDWHFECRIVRRDGEQRWILASGRHRLDPSGQLRRMSGIVQDITERKKMEDALREQKEELEAANEELRISEEELVSQLEELQQSRDALRESEEAFKALAENANDGILVAAGNGFHVFANKRAAEITGYSVDELARVSIKDLADSEEFDKKVKERYQKILTGEPVPRQYETLIVRKNGKKAPIEVTSAKTDWKGQPADLVIIRDITERKQSEEALRIIKDRLLFATEGANLGVWNWNTVTGELIWSDKCKALFGVPLDETMSYPRFSDALHPDDRERTDKAVKDALDNHKDYDIEYRSLWPDGSVHWLAAKGRGYYDATGKAVRLEGVVLDITESKRAEEEVRTLNIELEQRVRERTAQLETTNKELEAFSYSVSHDLRAPLRAIDGFSAALVEDFGKTLDPGAQDHLGRIRNGVRRMAELIEALLTLSRVSRTEMTRERVDLSALARDIAGKLEKDWPGRKAEWRIQEGLVAEGDPQLLRAVLENLLDNAWKFTSKTERAVIEFGTMAESDGKAVFSVRDNGAGFNMAYANKLFGAFQRLHTVEEFPGTGIGLVTVQRIVHRHGGRVWGEGETGRGATFYFTL